MKDYEKLSGMHFNKQAPAYDARDTALYSREGKISCRNIASILKDCDYETLLDVGCGTGFLAELLAAEHDGKYIGLDISDGMIRVAREKAIANCSFLEGKCDCIPFGDEAFDVVCCSQSFHHYPNQRKAMAEAWRVLRRGGAYILSDTGIGGAGAWLDNCIFFRLSRTGDCRTQNRRSIERMMISSGFELKSSRQISRMIYTVVGIKPQGDC